MPTVFTEEGYRFKIYFNDHPPAHAHVEKAGHEARVTLLDIEIVSNEGFSNRELGRIKEITLEHQAELLQMWDSIHESR